MKTVLKYILTLFVLGYGLAAKAQTTTLTLSDMTWATGTTWKFGTVACSSTNDVTSITLSMINNQISGNSSGIAPSQTLNSLGNNPRTTVYLFTPAITAVQVQNFIKGITFTKTTDHAGANPYVDIMVDANPTKLPAGATITVWQDHPDGTPHYYVWVASASIHYGVAYTAAKSFYFMGMRGYLPTITSLAENKLLTQISNQEGWSGGARTPDVISDKQSITNPTRNNSTGANYRWLCGPETDIFYYKGPTYNTAGAGAMNGAFLGWNLNEPNDSSGAENVMQVNFTAALLWNDYAPTNGAIKGYFIEFGGSGEAYSVPGYGSYPANPKYKKPTVTTNNDQWYFYSPGNTANTSTKFKANTMRANVMVIE